jgi:hypothetical protein
MHGAYSRLFGYRCFAALVSWVIGVMPAVGASSNQKPLGKVAEADRAYLGGACALNGATIYAGDVVETDKQGTLRLSLGKGQLYLSASSSASLEEHAGLASVTLARGSATFSMPDPAQFELETPAGVLRGSGRNASRGQVVITKPSEIVVSASHGDLVLDNDGQFYTIPEGKSYRVVVDDVRAPAPGDGTSKDTGHRKRRLLFFLVVGGTLVAATLPFSLFGSESPYKITT